MQRRKIVTHINHGMDLVWNISFAPRIDDSANHNMAAEIGWTAPDYAGRRRVKFQELAEMNIS